LIVALTQFPPVAGCARNCATKLVSALRSLRGSRRSFANALTADENLQPFEFALALCDRCELLAGTPAPPEPCPATPTPIEDARARQRRHRRIGGVLLAAAVAAGALIAGMADGGPSNVLL
jgi:ferric-dicitrate binding protein FerR (iron transport regulator)